MEKQPGIYHAAIALAKLVNSIVRHWPRGYKNNEGQEMRRAATEVVKNILEANRAQNGSEQRRYFQQAVGDNIALIEATIVIVNDSKTCIKTPTGQRWERLISAKTEVRLQGAISCVSKQLYGWRRVS